MSLAQLHLRQRSNTAQTVGKTTQTIQRLKKKRATRLASWSLSSCTATLNPEPYIPTPSWSLSSCKHHAQRLQQQDVTATMLSIESMGVDPGTGSRPIGTDTITPIHHPSTKKSPLACSLSLTSLSLSLSLSDRTLWLPTFSHFLIVNKTSLSLSLPTSLPYRTESGRYTDATLALPC